MKSTRGPAEATSKKRLFVESIVDLTSLPPSLVEGVIRDKSDDFDLLSPAQYYESLVDFTLYVREHDNPFQLFSPSKQLPTAPVLHDLGCIVLEASRGSKSGLAATLWFAAANWGFAPSACSFAAMLARSGQYGKDSVTAPAEQRFRALVRAGDPVAAAIEGEILYQQGKYAEAEAALLRVQRRQAAGTADLGSWEPNFRLALGRTLGRRGKADQAVAILRGLSDEGYIAADAELGRLLRGADPDAAMQYLFRPGCTGALSCFEEMAAIELDKAAKAEKPSDAADHRLWAEELTRLADKNAEF
ncbi:hypothetical protein ISF_03635 [Cordyceps fumosorosea ARSEF 2679]|uniref:Tetratricopeptide-like helical n=1 Tax=Cordyceps fumosorosea (strain ARSEF 2679) TaxID=1081104 RepID=A0A167ZFP5_CORFA|nr:hypothetical protein ISF_03635 [Cordyceps fumosorosea ARSEF 2679]OAA67459.1 hypothetical protein ISF_03635 [Cordyceps fumosorosea ARSEF 2679]